MTAQEKPGPETVDGQAEEIPEAPMPPEAAEAIEDFIPGPAELAVVDPTDQHEVMLSMDEHDVRMLLERVQSSALRKWVYELEQGRDPAKWPRGLTIHAVQDITQMLNWTGKCRIGVLPETLTVDRITEDAGNGPEPFWVATIFARDEVTGASLPGAAMEPQRMRLRKSTADAKRKDGKPIPEDNTIFDVFSRTKAIQKATRNALGAFIPEQVEQTIIAMFANDPSRVERIRTESEAKLDELPPPLDDEEARKLIAEAEAIYDGIVWPEARVEFPPGTFAAWKLQAQHSHDRLRDLVSYVEKRRDELKEKYGGGS